MSLLKSPWFWAVAGIITTISAYMICSVSAVGFMIFYVMSPASFGLAIRTYLKRSLNADEWLYDDWQHQTDRNAYDARLSLTF